MAKAKSKGGRKKSTKKKDDVKTEVVIGEYNGHPVITLPNGSRFGFTFGLRKAQAILKHVDDITSFVVHNEEEGEE